MFEIENYLAFRRALFGLSGFFGSYINLSIEFLGRYTILSFVQIGTYGSSATQLLFRQDN